MLGAKAASGRQPSNGRLRFIFTLRPRYALCPGDGRRQPAQYGDGAYLSDPRWHSSFCEYGYRIESEIPDALRSHRAGLRSGGAALSLVHSEAELSTRFYWRT